MGGEEDPIPPAPPLDESAYISDEEDTFEKFKRGVKNLLILSVIRNPFKLIGVQPIPFRAVGQSLFL